NRFHDRLREVTEGKRSTVDRHQPLTAILWMPRPLGRLGAFPDLGEGSVPEPLPGRAPAAKTVHGEFESVRVLPRPFGTPADVTHGTSFSGGEIYVHFERFAGNLAMARGCVRRAPGFGRRFRARGSQRPGRLPTRW